MRFGSNDKGSTTELMKKSDSGTATKQPSRLRELTDQLQQLETRLRRGGGADKIDRQHQQGKLTARERLELLLDKGSYSQEIGLLVAYDQYEGGAPAAGVVTVVGRVEGREVVVVANDATVKAGSWWPETIKKILRAQEIAMRSRVPIIYLVDSAGVNLPYQGGVFPGQYGGGRIFFYYPRLQSASVADESVVEITEEYQGIGLKAKFTALPAADAMDGEQVLCCRAYVAGER